MKTIFIELSDGIFEVIIDNDKPLKETPKSYKFREFAKSHSLYHSEYLSNIMSIYEVKDGSLRYSIVEDGCFIGSRCIVVEGVIVEKEAVLGANGVLTQSTKIIGVSGPVAFEMRGRVPARSVVIPGSYTKKFPAGEYGVGCALIIGQRKPSTDLKTSLNDALRDFNVSV